MSRIASTSTTVSSTEMMDLRYWVRVASTLRPFSKALPTRDTARPISQRPTTQATMAPTILSAKSAPCVLRNVQMASMFIIAPFKAG